MSTSIVEKVLGANKYYTEQYLKDSLNLVKSIVIKNDQEARLYNEHLKLRYSGHLAPSDPMRWRYYMHLKGLPYEIDVPMVITSWDNGDTITVTRESLAVHRKTKLELLKFEQLYDQTVKAYPEQELLLKSLIVDVKEPEGLRFYDADDFTIIGYNKALVEPREHDVIGLLQERLTNHKNIWLIGYYSVANNLFLAAQFTILYHFLYKGLLAIRLSHAKTVQAHSFHIRLYLASHHELDAQMPFLNERQQLFLYRNLLYLNNHAGAQKVFDQLIETLYTERNISVVTYQYEQLAELDHEDYPKFHFKPRLLNAKPLGYSETPYSLEFLSAKEAPLAPGNPMVLERHHRHLVRHHRSSLYAHLLTKDLQTQLYDETDSVPDKLLSVLVDYWAYFLKKKLVNFLVDVTDPNTGTVVRMNTGDLFNFFMVCLYARHRQPMPRFADYRIKKIFVPVKPTEEQLLAAFYNPVFEHRADVDTLISALPTYSYMTTGYQFSEFVSNAYNLEMGLWTWLANEHHIDTHGQMAGAVRRVHTTELLEGSSEAVEAFIARIGLPDPRMYKPEVLERYISSILDSLFDGRMGYLQRLVKLQGALGAVFANFHSYTVQFINNYYSDSPTLVGLAAPRFAHTYSVVLDVGGDNGDGDSGAARGVVGNIVVRSLLSDQTSAHLRSLVDYNDKDDSEHSHSYHQQVDVLEWSTVKVSTASVQEAQVNLCGVSVFETTEATQLQESADLLVSSKPQSSHYSTFSLAQVSSCVNVQLGFSLGIQTRALINSGTSIQVETMVTPAPATQEHLFFLATSL